MTDRELRIAEALQKIDNGCSIVAAARDFKILRSTLQGRLKGSQPRRNLAILSQKLSPVQEETLINWILDIEAAGRAPSQRDIYDFASLVLAEGGNELQLGHNWVSQFLHRHPNIKMKPSRGLEALRSNSTRPERLEDWILLVKWLMDRLGVGPDCLYNMDETGMAEGQTRRGKVAGTHLLRYGAVTNSDPTPWVSAIEAGSASGRFIRLVIISPGLPSKDNGLLTIFLTGGLIIVQQAGPMARFFLRWLRKVSLSETKPENRCQWRILIIDGHKAYLTIPFQYTTWKNLYYVLYLPSHTSHVSQPLDVGVFSPLKSAFHRHTRAFVSFDSTAPIQKQRFIQAYRDARDEALTSSNIRAGFRASGLWPCNIERLIQAGRKAGQPPPQDPTPKTPKKPHLAQKQVCNTPKSGSAFKEMMYIAMDNAGSLHRN
jgi:4-hydroxybenzoate polyprenyltransferase